MQIPTANAIIVTCKTFPFKNASKMFVGIIDSNNPEIWLTSTTFLSTSDITGKKNELIKNVTATINKSIRKNLPTTVEPILLSIVTSSIAQMPATIEKNIMKTVTVTIKAVSVDKIGSTISFAKIFWTSGDKSPMTNENAIAKTIAIVIEPPGSFGILRSFVE